jgi:hypothetical protein
LDRLRCDLLCEDREQEALFRKILESRSARVRVLPRKVRGGFTFVHQQLKTAVTYIRQRPGEAVGLLVIIDGDQLGVAGRWDEIRRLAGLTGAAWEARVAVCIPRRNVETWELWLCGRRDLEESSDYKREWQRAVERGEVSVRQAIDAWFRRLKPDDEETERRQLPALAHGRSEIDRLFLAAS